MTLNHFRVGVLVAVASLFVVPTCWGALASYSQDFESLALTTDPSNSALEDDGWLTFGNVFDANEVFKFDYGADEAPNGGPGFSGVATGEAGPGQGVQYLHIYSDYNCCDPNQGHRGGDLVESNVYQEQTIGGSDVGLTGIFNFDAKLPSDAAVALESPSTAAAFIKTVDPTAGFAIKNLLTVDTTNLPDTWDSFSIELFIDGGLDGQLIQFGFLSNSTNFDNTGIYYDNVDFRVVPVPAAVWLFVSALGLLAAARRRFE